jgi:hypothetical protein
MQNAETTLPKSGNMELVSAKRALRLHSQSRLPFLQQPVTKKDPLSNIIQQLHLDCHMRTQCSAKFSPLKVTRFCPLMIFLITA